MSIGIFHMSVRLIDYLSLFRCYQEKNASNRDGDSWLVSKVVYEVLCSHAFYFVAYEG